jgi:ankyrin repeat protein
VFCQLDTLRHCLPSSVRHTLERLPESLDETYERIVMDIKKANKGPAYRMLQCLAVAIRPLSVSELAELLAFEFDAAKGGIPKLNAAWRWEDHEQAVLSTCSSLITIVPTEESHVVQFSHFSVKEFLMSDRLSTLTKDISRYHIIPEDANTLIARACLGVLLRDPVDKNGASTGPLAQYAAEHWVSHAQVENVASRIRDGMLCLFDPDRPYFSAWLELHDVDNRGWLMDLRGNIQQRAAPLYYAAFCGFHEIVDRLTLKYPTYANAIGGYGGTALHSASYAGHVLVVRSLLKCGADVDTPGYGDQSSLQFASIKGHLDIVLYLLNHGADAKFRDANYRTPLDHAAAGGHLEIVRVLLGHSADVHSKDKTGSTPLSNAIFFGRLKGDHAQIVQLFLEHGANPNTRNNKHQAPLHLVSSPHLSRGLVLSVRLEIVRILLAHGADVDAEEKEGRTPLQVALAEKDGEMVQLLSAYCSK